MSESWRDRLATALEKRFGEAVAVPDELAGGPTLAKIADHRTMRRYDGRPVPEDLLRLLCAVALSAPSKSDMQQADIVVVNDPERRRAIIEPIADANPWLREAPVLLIICGNNHRQRELHRWRGHAFANDHLDPFFNASVDAGIVLGTLIVAAEAAGLGTCSVSAVRNHAAEVSRVLDLPSHAFPVAGLALGWPAWEGVMSPRLPLAATLHHERVDDSRTRDLIDDYDRRRHGVQPYRSQRDPARFGKVELYGWSEDKARQYAVPERADFGAFVRSRGFRLE